MRVWFVHPPGKNIPNTPGWLDNVGRPIVPEKGSRVLLKGGDYVVDSVRWDFDSFQVHILLR